MPKKEYLKNYRLANPQKIKEHAKKYRTSENGKSTRKKYHLVYMRNYRKNHPEKIKHCRGLSQRKLWMKKISKRDGFLCKKCKTDKNLTLQHIIPRCIGGKYSYNNLEILCLQCNIKDYHQLVKKALRNYYIKTV